MVLIKNKKGMFFTITVITLLTFFLASYGVYSIAEKQITINKRITSMNNFVFSIEEDIPRKLYIAGFRIIFLFEEEIIETGEYIGDFDLKFQEAFFNGTLNNETENLLINSKFEDISNSLNEKGQKINVNVSLLNPKIYITQEDPWNVKITLNVNLIVKDLANLASWNKTTNISTLIPIENFEDPLYIVNTDGLIINKINKTIYSDFIDGNNVSNLLDHLEHTYYINSTLAPSFLDKLKGIATANENGIESLVNLEKLSSQGIDAKNKTVVDYIYFSTNNPQANQISGMPNWFMLDDAHKDIYS